MVGRIHSLPDLDCEIVQRELLQSIELGVAVPSVPTVVVVEVATDTVAIDLNDDSVDPPDIES